MGFCLISIESVVITQNILRENFRDLSKIRENCETILLRSFCHLPS